MGQPHDLEGQSNVQEDDRSTTEQHDTNENSPSTIDASTQDEVRQPKDDPRTQVGKAMTPRKRLLIASILSLMCFSTTFSSSAYASSVFSLQAEFGASQEVVLLGVALFVLGFAVGPLLFGPLAFVVGKRPVYVGTFICFTAFSFGVAEAQNIETIIILRFLAGVCGSSALNNVPSSLNDILELHQLNVFMMFYALGSTAGPGISPVVMGFVDHRAGWRWNMRVQAILVAVATLSCILFVGETADKNVVPPPTNGIGNQPAPTIKSPSKTDRFHVFWRALRTSLSRPFVWLFTEPVVTVICLHVSVLYGVLYGAFEAVPFVFLGKRHWSEESSGLFFLSLLLGFFLGGLVIVVVQGRFYRKLEEQGKPIVAEARFQQALWGAFLPPFGLFLFAWTAPYVHVHWIVPAIGMLFFSAGMVIIFTSLLPYVSIYAGREAPMAMAATTFTRSAFGCFFPLITTKMFEHMTVQGAASFLAAVTLLLAPVPLVLKRKGARLRARGKKGSS